MIRIRVIRSPPIASIDGIQLDCFRIDNEYLVGNTIGALFLAEGWAEPVLLDAPAPVVPFGEGDQFDSRLLYPDRDVAYLTREPAPQARDPEQTAVAKQRRQSRRKH